MWILLVEDEVTNRDAFRLALERFGYQVLAAADAQEASAILERHAREIEAVVADVVLPDCTGGEILRIAREACPNVPILFVSGSPADILCENGLLDPGDLTGDAAYVQKPMFPAQFVSELERLLAGVRA